MPSTLTMSLPKAIEARATRFFGCAFDQVSVHVNRRPGALGALAFTNGEDIWMDPLVASLPLERQWQVFGHELTHIVQQRQGRVFSAGPGCLQVHDRQALEREADYHAELFANGGTSEIRGTNAVAKSPGMLQCLVAIDGQKVQNLSDLPSSVQMVTSIIEGGQNWFEWAAKEPVSVFDFPDWPALVDGIQIGLHGNDLVLIGSLGLLVSPVALLSMPDLGISALETYLTAGSGNSVADIELEKVLRQSNYLSQSQLTLVTDFLSQVELSGNPLFQAMSLGDRIAIYRAINQLPGDWALQPANQTEAAGYASDYATSPRAFADFYTFYMANFAIPELDNLSPDRRARMARLRSDQIAATLRNDMRCPAVVGNPAPEQFQRDLRAWFSAGNGLGFSRVSQGVAVIAGLKKAEDLTGQALTRQIDKYLERAKSVVNHGEPNPEPTVAQDGSAFFYTFDARDMQTVLQLECGSGAVTLAEFTDSRNAMTTDGDSKANSSSITPT